MLVTFLALVALAIHQITLGNRLDDTEFKIAYLQHSLLRTSSHHALSQQQLQQQHRSNNDSSNPKDLKILLFITTIFSENHLRHLSCCWPKLMEHSKLLPNVDVMMFVSNTTKVPKVHLWNTQALFAGNPSYTVKYPSPDDLDPIQTYDKINRFQMSANLGPKLGFSNGWFDDYDWVIRINPDVLIRNSTWLLQTMHDPTVDGIFVNCKGRHPRIHTDFFAVRPHSKWLPKHAFEQMVLEPWSKILYNHEGTAHKYFTPIIKSKRHRYLPDADDSRGYCRVRGEHTSVFHGHTNCKNEQGVCDALENYSIS
jgi:hypothetical protein